MLSKHSETQSKIKELIGKKFNIEIIHKNKYIITVTIKDYKPEQTPCLTYSITLVDSVCKNYKSCYP